jgi:hypothetical protein|tara:strand:+ start:280 stop:702 length:423 start_codon:yes stop_codon:yes gene_type:complete
MGKPERYLREHSFLCNPRTPQRVLRGLRSLELPAVPTPHKGAESAEGRALVERLKSGADGDATVLSITSKIPDYRALLSASELKGFEREVASYGGLWCCNRPPGGKGAGHIWYDFLADVVPHRDRHNRNFEGEWKPIMGP